MGYDTVGDCSASLAHGSTCTPTCPAGQSLASPGKVSCLGGVLSKPICGIFCDASALGANFATVGDCTSELASGSSCTPTCKAGFVLKDSKKSTCSGTTLTAAECVRGSAGKPWGSYAEVTTGTCEAAGCVSLFCPPH